MRGRVCPHYHHVNMLRAEKIPPAFPIFDSNAFSMLGMNPRLMLLRREVVLAGHLLFASSSHSLPTAFSLTSDIYLLFFRASLLPKKRMNLSTSRTSIFAARRVRLCSVTGASPAKTKRSHRERAAGAPPAKQTNDATSSFYTIITSVNTPTYEYLAYITY